MIIVKLQGGLGNQLFQYAFGRALADSVSHSLYLDLTTLQDTNLRENFSNRKFELGQFPIRAKIADQKILKSVVAYPKNRLDFYRLRLLKFMGIVQHLHERKFSYDDELLRLIHGQSFLTGFWQSEKYFKSIGDEIRRDLKLSEPKDEKNINYYRHIQTCNAVSVHVRRGDYVNNQTHPLCSIRYYLDAIEQMRKTIANPVFFLFSDDTEWVRDKLSIHGQCYIIDHNNGNSAADLFLMSQCKNHIIANSTFSWWGAWLSVNPNKRVIAPQNWFNNPEIDTKDLIPEHWTVI